MLRLGILGAARIAPAAVIRPARTIDDVTVVAVAARDRARAAAYARKHDIPTVYGSYEDLVSSPDIDAVYVPLPNGFHGRWTIAALQAEKHVLCEKPFAANAAEASQVKSVADASGRVVMEAFHWRYHPLASRMLAVIASGDLGSISHIEAALCFPLPKWSDIRWQLDLAGGSLMDAGCYPVHIVRTLAGSDPSVISARMKERTPGVDRWTRAELAFPNGTTGRVTAAMWSATVVRMSARVVGDKGTMSVINPVMPQMFNLLTVRQREGGTHRERIRGDATYHYQLEAFVEAVLRGGLVLTPPSDSVATMTVIDEIYRQAGLQPRGAWDSRS